MQLTQARDHREASFNPERASQAIPTRQIALWDKPAESMFQSRTGFPGHSDTETSTSVVEGVEVVSIPNGLPRPFRPLRSGC